LFSVFSHRYVGRKSARKGKKRLAEQMPKRFYGGLAIVYGVFIRYPRVYPKNKDETAPRWT
jgi:hypothetical protein